MIFQDLLASIGLFPDAPEPSAAPFPFRAAADSFSPEIKELMSQFGVLPLQLNSDHVPTTRQPIVPTVDAGSFSSFKPIPDRLNIDDEMKDFLAQFGLVDRKTSSRQLTTPTPEVQTVQPVQPSEEPEVEKSKHDFKIRAKESSTLSSDSVTAAPTQIPTLHPDSMSNEMKRVLFELGLAPHLTRDDIQDIPAVQVESNESPGFDLTLFEDRSSNNHEFVFNPTDAAPLNDTMEEKLKKILNTFKYLNNTNQSPEEVEHQLQEATKLFSKYRKVSNQKEKVFYIFLCV